MMMIVSDAMKDMHPVIMGVITINFICALLSDMVKNVWQYGEDVQILKIG